MTKYSLCGCTFQMNPTKQAVEELALPAGILVDADEHPWDVSVHDERFYARVLADGSLGLGESYMDGWWDSEAIDEMIFRLLRADVGKNLPLNPNLFFLLISSQITNRQNKRKAVEVAEIHYNLGNDLFRAMLDMRLT